MFQGILSIIYPARCPVCGEIVEPIEDMVCLSCRDKLIKIEEPRCKKCSKPLENEEKEYCSDCERKNYHFQYGYSVWVYNDIMKKSISDFKYKGRKEYAGYYVREVIRYYGDKINKLAPDLIAPIPIHKSKYRERGYNQADILAKMIGKKLGITVVSNLLIRSRKTLPQKQLSDKERLHNLQEAFRINPDISQGIYHINKVLLIDDIYTTGSTMEACTNSLIKHGIEDVFFVTLCIGRGY